MIVIVDYGLGNLSSIGNMLRRIGSESLISRRASDVLNATQLILPGVGSFDTGMINIHNFGLRPALDEAVLQKKIPTLGVCLGMQLFTQKSEEGRLPGLGWISGETVKLTPSRAIKVPHMGWNYVKVCNSSHSLAQNFNAGSRFYFAHSYRVVCKEPQDVVMTTFYGQDFPTVVARDNIYGVQFHPEKSHRFGMQLLKNFVDRIC